jgi:hypothetical protein
MPTKSEVDCVKCKHFHVTWDPHFPKGCTVFKFKSKYAPSQTVYEATGKFCEEFEEKPKSREKGGARP